VVVSVGEKKRRLSKGELVLSMAWMASKRLRMTVQIAWSSLRPRVSIMAVEGPDIGVIASGAESGHIESDPQVTVPGLGQGAFCSRWSRTGAGVDRGRPWRSTA